MNCYRALLRREPAGSGALLGVGDWGINVGLGLGLGQCVTEARVKLQ